ncbi:MAG: DMT family transporter [Alphaproteobacteria bacterium]
MSIDAVRRAAAARLPLLAAGAAALACILGGSGVVAMRVLVAETDPVTVAFLRTGLATLLLGGVALVTVRQRIPLRDVAAMAGLGLFSFGIYQWLVAGALQYGTAARVAIGSTSMPFMALLVAALAGIEKPSPQKVGGLGLAACGVALAMWQDAAAGPGAWRGDALVLFASLLGGAAAVFAVPYVRRYPPLVVVAVGTLPAVLMLWGGTLATGAPAFAPALSTTGWLLVLWLGLGSATGAYFLFHWALRHTTPTLVSISITLNPVTALLLAACLLGEPATAGLVAGLAIVVTGIVVANLRRRPRPLAAT